ncbi:MAG: hypothetical protein Q8O55_03950 [Dehalococcoidales bacterium]|nr:hypothetical protein [Dehalococcoidales bacterium]
MKCKDCDREFPTASNADTAGWVIIGDEAFCPTCLRLANVEKKLLECQHAIVGLGKLIGGQVEIPFLSDKAPYSGVTVAEINRELAEERAKLHNHGVDYR